jgi:hypothetical protein
MIGGIKGFRIPGLPRDDFMSIEREPELRVPSFDYVAPNVDQDAINKALEAVTVRKEANDAINNATDQYEADVADFKNTQATEIEQGIATLPEILNLSQVPFVPEGIAAFTPPREPTVSRMPNEISVPFVPPLIRSEREPVEAAPDIIPATDPVVSLPFPGEGGREDFVRDFKDTGFGNYIVDEPVIPINTPPANPVAPVDNPYTNIFNIPGNDLAGMIPGYFDINEEDFYNGIGEPPFDDTIFPPYTPPIIDPDPDPIVPPPVDEGPTGPINYYTGKPINNPYTPYSTDSGAAPLQKAITPRTFGSAPGFEPPPPKQPLPIIRPPIRKPPRDDRIFVPPPDDFPEKLRPIAMAPGGAKNGGYLNNGISMLPMNGQGDTLTTQVFQSGFRPRR